MNISMAAKNIWLSSAVVKETESLLLPHDFMETVVYWFGRITLKGTEVLTVVRPGQTRTPGSFQVSATANADVSAYACEHDMRLIAQLHSHPGRFVGHSTGDDHGAPFVFEEFYSIVVPHYGAVGLLPLTRCGVHVYRKGFRRLSASQITSTFHVFPYENEQI